ncbi:MAG: hypothetical protein FJ303_10590 [Planctomycetes bacterium]|nr:hypothetical protein [Planctomycetota bacterium]
MRLSWKSPDSSAWIGRNVYNLCRIRGCSRQSCYRHAAKGPR